jgi:hypothetical protein
MTRRLLLALFFEFCAFSRDASGQLQNPANDQPVRVTVSINDDGTRTAYEFDPANHRATATTTTAEGKPVGKTHYVLDHAGRFASGEVYGIGGKFRFKSIYKYDAAGRLQEETQSSRDGVLQNKIVYAYDKAGKQTGYAVYDGGGKLLGRATPVTPTGAPGKTKTR